MCWGERGGEVIDDRKSRRVGGPCHWGINRAKKADIHR